MFNVNPMEIVVIAVLALVLFGPEKLPEMAVQLGKLYRDFRLMADSASAEFTREIQEAARIDAVEEAETKTQAPREQSIAPPRAPEEADPTVPGSPDVESQGHEAPGGAESEPPAQPETGPDQE